MDQPRFFVSDSYSKFRRICDDKGWNPAQIVFIHPSEFENPERLKGVWREDVWPPHFGDLLPSKYTDQSSPFYGLEPEG